MYRKTILLVDPEVQRRAQIRYTLALHGYFVLEAACVGDAKTIWSAPEISIDLVIRDTDGDGSVEWPEWRPCVPLLLLSQFSQSQVESGSDDFWSLPFDPERLLLQVAWALRSARGGST
ncbi:MAG: hypothetical protein JO270_24115 [Acidobacteriaceae bacterium]|nr:hypothetical protein [Acidobacteriaceae bacterium]MBV8572154.1 hypothetical protein [Acidobacteriaceae bacterium]